MDRMASADGGDPDPSSTRSKGAERAKPGRWEFPRYLAARVFTVIDTI
jgi:hypothetical protein